MIEGEGASGSMLVVRLCRPPLVGYVPAMSCLAWIIAAVVLCPAWWRVAQEAERLRSEGRGDTGRLPVLLHKAALYTAGMIAVLALVALIAAVGAHPGAGDALDF